jgi:antitoxin (DNA-binding transcriptional repressor) of toxin-antitoxin stability system
MITITFTEFRNRASAVLDDIEKGEIVRILRHGKPVAEISPIVDATDDIPSWKKPAMKLCTKGIALSKAIQEERSASDHETIS